MCLNVTKLKRKKMREVKGKKSKYSFDKRANKEPECYNYDKRGHYRIDFPEKENIDTGKNSHVRTKCVDVLVASNRYESVGALVA